MRSWIVRVVRKNNEQCDVRFESEREAKAYIDVLNLYDFKEINLCTYTNDEVVSVGKMV